MEATPLCKLLQSLCHDFHWDYAVFWKLHPEQMLLKWEEGYCYNPTIRRSIESEQVNMGFIIADPIFSTTWDSGRHDGYLNEFPVGVSLNDMASVQYHLGEGVVGKVAYSGSHSWILSEDLLFCDFESNVVPECPDEWLLQFATGIKTIVLIPVAHHGVLQLGSFKKVGEDPMLVALVREKFNAYINNMDVPTLSFEYQIKKSLSPISKFNLDGFSTSRNTEMKHEDHESVFYNYNTTNTNKMMPVNLAEDACLISGENRIDNGNIMRGNEFGYQFVDLDAILPLDHDLTREMFGISMTGSSIMEENINSLSYSDYNFGIFGDDLEVEAKLVEPFVDENTDFMTKINSLFSFSMDCELHKALGSTFQRQSNEQIYNPTAFSEDSKNSSSVLLNKNLIQGNNEPSSLEPNDFLLNRDDEENLSEKVYATFDSFLNDDMSKEPNEAKMSVESSDQLSVTTNECVFNTKTEIPRSSMTINGPYNVATQSSPPFSTENTLSTLITEDNLKKGYKYPQNKKGSKLCKKRAEPCKSPKPRPRDRQLIQDRVKELRELVPNGSKCSIDGLLDKAIRHMLFLRGVSERADKLRHWVNQEVTGRKKMRVSSPDPDSKNGTSWAFELGSDFQVCPIVVKDLEHPGHMLIEMLCNDNGIFLEIAEVIRRLDLTILKGVMESRTNNTWAHFIVEVSRGFQRLDIFWPLMELLQKNRAPISD